MFSKVYLYHFVVPPAMNKIPIALHLGRVRLVFLFFPFLFFSPRVLGVELYLIVDLIYISLITNSVEHLFTCLFAIPISPLVKCLLSILSIL